MSSKLKGRNISVLMEIDGEREMIAYARDCDINVQADMQEFSNMLSGRAKRHRAGRYSWDIGINTLIADSAQPAQLLEALKDGTQLTLTVDAQLPYDGNICVLRGNAMAQNWSIAAPLQGLATFRATFIGDGELNLVPTKNPSPPPRGE